MQLLTLLRKDIQALFKQRAIIFTLLIPMFLIVGLGLLPSFIGLSSPIEIGLYNNDQGNGTINLGNAVIQGLTTTDFSDQNINFVIIDSQTKFFETDNAFWFPANFTTVANETGTALYYLKYSDSDLRANSVMNGPVADQIETIVVEDLLQVTLPNVNNERLFADTQGMQINSQEHFAEIAYPLAYMAFLILILSTGSMRVTGFSAEREAGMMELLLSSVTKRSELVLSKLITGVLYGLASVTSYIFGILIVFLIQGGSQQQEVSFLVLPAQLISPFSLLVIFLLFADLSFLAIQILLAAQLILGREAGDRLGSMALMLLSFLFYFGSIGDPLSEVGLQVMNPFFWPYRIALNLIFGIDPYKTITYLILNLGFSWYLLLVMTRSIEKEQVLFE